MAGNAIPVKVFKVLAAGDAQPVIKRFGEEASQTFLMGVPVTCNVAVSGDIYAWAANANVAANNVAGFSTEPGSNLTANHTARHLTYGSVQGQANAVQIPIGAPINDGTVGVILATDTIIFVAKCNDAHNIALTDIGTVQGMTKDTNNYFFIEFGANNAAANGAFCLITELVDPVGTAGGKLAFRIVDVAQQFGGRTPA